MNIVLVCEKSRTVQKMVELVLASTPHELICIPEYQQASDKIHELKPNVLLIDIRVNDAAGYRLCQSIKTNQELQSIPVILLIGIHESVDEAKLREVNPTSYLLKPFTSEELLSQIQKCVEAFEVPVGEESLAQVEDVESTPVEAPPVETVETLGSNSIVEDSSVEWPQAETVMEPETSIESEPIPHIPSEAKFETLSLDVAQIDTQETNPSLEEHAVDFLSSVSEQREREGEAPMALPMEGAALAPTVDRSELIRYVESLSDAEVQILFSASLKEMLIRIIQNFPSQS